MFCSRCGKNITEPLSFCSNCGAPITQIPSGQPTATEQSIPEHNNAEIPVQQNINQRNPDSIPPQYRSSVPPKNAQPMNNYPPVYNAAPPVYQAEQPKKKKGKAGKIIGIIFGILAALALAGVLLFGVLIGVGFIVHKEKEPVNEIVVVPNEMTTASEEIPEDIYYDPVYYFRTNEKSYYRVSNSPSADLYLYTEFGEKNSYFDTLTPNALVYVFGIYDGWACIEYPDSIKGYCWCIADSLFKTDEVPEEYNKYEDPIHYFSSYEKAYYRVYGTNTKGLNLRTEPNTDSEVITVLQESEQVLVYGIEDGWAYVRTDDSRTQSDLYGWCTTEYLSYYDDYYGE